MRKLKHRDLRNRALAAIEDLRWIADNARNIADRANDDIDEAMKSPSYDTDGRGGAELTGPERHADRKIVMTRDAAGNRVAVRDANGNPVMRKDTVQELMTKLLGTIGLAAQSARAARDISGNLITSQDTEDRKTQWSIASAIPTAGKGHCSNCTRLCPGTRDDRIKSGRCAPGCYEYFVRHGTERPRALWETTP